MAHFVLQTGVPIIPMRRFLNLSGPAFALIELLAILGIAAVLSSLLLPALGEMKERARVERNAEIQR